MPTPRLLITVPVLATLLSAGLLASAGGPAAGETSSTSAEAAVVTTVQRQVAQRLTALLTPRGAKPADGVPVGLDAGIIGVTGSAADGYEVVVTRETDPKALVARLTAGLPTAARSTLTVRSSVRTADELRTAWRQVSAQAWAGDAAQRSSYSMDLDPELEAVVVDVEGAAPAAGRLDLQRAPVEDVQPGAVVVRYTGDSARASRSADTAPHWGGARITAGGTSCTSGFTVKSKTASTRYSVTAGHCGPNGTSWSSGSYYFGQTAGRTGYPEYDQARLAGSTYTNSIYTDGLDNFSTRLVTGANDGDVGDSVCVSGAVTKSVCGIEIKSLSATYCDDPARPATCSTYLMRGRRDDDRVIVRKGDSGGPVYQRNTSLPRASIRGMVIAYDMSGVRLYAERYNSISNHLGVVAIAS
ncbi:hypothetical protein [Mumia zhuanghuii]|uniref:Streptogrisin C n=1 Tax=Mumia zhuanghuii TaxID=2585211 RepID=A0A5C4MH83_9ACTN|nr:hypothetical protein [Mumia zhuanghuii]TNC38351.1 hypothetical protein FHE65_24340 [Mumia zhuanghuii]TNC48277.1 hypothetical protein FHE65_07565 [Mumia zhuanghuii]